MFVAMKLTVANMLLEMKGYNPNNVPALERYVEIQSFENEYDLVANLALLRLYQLYPKRFNIDIASQILFKALTNLPHNDYTLCINLVQPEHLDEDPISCIIYLAGLLEHCKFQRFWNDYLQMSELTKSINGFKNSIRKLICNTVKTTYERIEKANLAELLGKVNNNTLAKWVTKYGWKEEEGGWISIKNLEKV